jgi:hypothetical protein
MVRPPSTLSRFSATKFQYTRCSRNAIQQVFIVLVDVFIRRWGAWFFLVEPLDERYEFLGSYPSRATARKPAGANVSLPVNEELDMEWQRGVWAAPQGA